MIIKHIFNIKCFVLMAYINVHEQSLKDLTKKEQSLKELFEHLEKSDL
jgi:hypothetical protein